MSDSMPGKRYGALHAWFDGSVWRYLPNSPAPQRNADGRAQLTAVEAADMLMLTLGTSLTASDAHLSEAREAISAETGGKADAIDLRPADATPRGATLTLALDGQEPIELARANPSPLAPYTAAFSAMLRGDQAKQANAAMKDGTGRLEVTYDLDLPMERSVTARIEGEPGKARDVETALETGELTLAFEVDAGASSGLKAEARRRVVENVTQILSGLEQPAKAQESAIEENFDDESSDHGTGGAPEVTTATAIDAHVTCTEPAPRTLRLVANVADWL